MTSIEALKRIKVLLGIEKLEATAKLADGTAVHVDTEFEVGATLHVIQEDGTFVPAPEGVHLLEDGRTELYVDAAGVITAIETKEEELEEVKEEEKVEVEMEEEKKEEETTPAPSAEEIVTAVMSALEPILTEVEGLKAQLEALSGSFQKFSNEPAAKPVRNNFKAENESAKSKQDARFEALVQIRKNK